MNQPHETDFITRHDIGSDERWRIDLEHVHNLLQIIHPRPPMPEDGPDLLKNELRRLLTAGALGEEMEIYAGVAHGSGAGAASTITQHRWREKGEPGIVILASPVRPPRSIPTGETGMTQPDWVKGFTLAALARDGEALQTLCNTGSIAALSLPPEQIDPFWPFYCGALAATVVEPRAVSAWVEDALRTLPPSSETKADPALIEAIVRPVLALVRALAEEDALAFNQRLRETLLAHRRFYSQPDLLRDWYGVFSLEGTALAALAFDRGMPVAVQSDYLPRALVEGSFPRELSTVTYQYPLYSIRSAQEAHWFLDLEGFPRTSRSHLLVEDDGQLIAQYDVSGAPGLPRARARFLLLESARPQSNVPPPALDPGELVALAETYARSAGATTLPDRQQRALLANAVDCIESALNQIPPGQEAVDPTQIRSATGRDLYAAEPGRFRRDRLEAYRDALEAQLKKIDARLESEAHSPAEGSGSNAAAGQEQPSATAEAMASAALAIALIQVQVQPILEAIAQDSKGDFIAGLAPLPEDYAKVFNGQAVESARRSYQELWAKKLPVQRPSSGYEVRIYVAPAGMLADENELSFHFPGGYRAIAGWLNPHRVWVAWKYAPRGQPAGLSYDGLVWVDDHWAWFPKPYRALRELASKPQDKGG